jgi:pyridoxal phosphate enzyme (YggS family)
MTQEAEIANSVRANLQVVRDRITAAAARASRDPGTVRLVLASKLQSADALRAAYDAGARDFGENYVQEGMQKREALSDLDGVRWHLIGHLQSNKVRQAVRVFDTIQTLDSERLALSIAREQKEPAMPVLIEINIGGEQSKSGIAPELVEPLLERVRAKVRVSGLMTVPPLSAEGEEARPFFSRMRELRDKVASNTGLALSELSMGMTQDFEIAIEEGATIVRVGRAVFGERRP